MSPNFCEVAFSMTISMAHPEDFGIRAELLDRSRPIEPRLYLYVERELARSTDSRSFFGSIGSALPHPHGPSPRLIWVHQAVSKAGTHNRQLRPRGTRSEPPANLPSSGGVSHANQLAAIVPFCRPRLGRRLSARPAKVVSGTTQFPCAAIRAGL